MSSAVTRARTAALSQPRRGRRTVVQPVTRSVQPVSAPVVQPTTAATAQASQDGDNGAPAWAKSLVDLVAAAERGYGECSGPDWIYSSRQTHPRGYSKRVTEEKVLQEAVLIHGQTHGQPGGSGGGSRK